MLGFCPLSFALGRRNENSNHRNEGGDRMRRIVTATIICTVVLVAIVRAEDIPKRALAEQLLGAMEIQKTIEKSFDMVNQMMTAQMKQMGVFSDDAISDKAQDVIQKTMDLVMKEMSWDKLKGDYISIYAETFTEEELKGAIKFYKSPIGKKFIEKQPELMRKSMQISQKQMTTLMPKIQKLTEEMMDQITAETTD